MPLLTELNVKLGRLVMKIPFLKELARDAWGVGDIPLLPELMLRF